MRPTPPPSRRWAVRRALRRRRRPLAALCTAAAVWAALGALAPPGPPQTQVAVAAGDLPAGAVVGPGDVAVVALPAGLAPDGATAPPPGAVLAAPVRRGEPFTDVRLVGAPAARPAGTVVVTVRTADPAAVLAVRPGDRVDLLAGPDVAGGGGPAAGAVVGRDLLVLDVPAATGAAPDDGAGGGLLDGAGGGTDTAGVLVLAVDRATLARFAGVTGRALTVAVVGP